jgi:phage terminase large subunit GpA-like protein
MTFYDDLWRRVCVPPDRRPIWQWAEEHIRSIPYSPSPGAFRVANSPQIKEVFAAITDPRVRVVSIIAAVQAAKTLVSEISLAYIIANMPGPTLWLNETDEDARDQSESRLQKLFDVCAPVRALYPANRHKKRNTTIHFSNGMTLWIVGAHNRTNLQRRSIRWIFADETWLYPTGHMAEAEARVRVARTTTIPTANMKRPTCGSGPSRVPNADTGSPSSGRISSGARTAKTRTSNTTSPASMKQPVFGARAAMPIFPTAMRRAGN